jgi:hypothetical protein
MNRVRGIMNKVENRCRLAHCIRHCFDAIQKVQAGSLEGEDDAGAILFAGSVLAEWRRMKSGE